MAKPTTAPGRLRGASGIAPKSRSTTPSTRVGMSPPAGTSLARTSSASRRTRRCAAAGLTSACATTNGNRIRAARRSAGRTKRRRDPGSTENRGSVEQSPEHDGRPCLHHVQGPGHDLAAHRRSHDRRRVQEDPVAGDRETARPVDDPLGSAADEVEESRADHPERGDAHRRDRPVEALREADAEVDAGVVSGQRRAAHRDRIQRRDRPGLRQPRVSVGVHGPFDVLRAAERALHPVAERRQRSHLRVRQAGRTLVGRCRRAAGRGSARSRCRRRSGRGPRRRTPPRRRGRARRRVPPAAADPSPGRP